MERTVKVRVKTRWGSSYLVRVGPGRDTGLERGPFCVNAFRRALKGGGCELPSPWREGDVFSVRVSDREIPNASPVTVRHGRSHLRFGRGHGLRSVRGDMTEVALNLARRWHLPEGDTELWVEVVRA